MWRLQKYTNVLVTTGEQHSGAGPDSTQGLRPGHQRERNPEWAPSNSEEDRPFMMAPKRVPEDSSYVESTGRNSRKSRRFSPAGEMRPISTEV